MKYLLDTNVCVAYFKGRSESIKASVDAACAADIVVCSIVWAELALGAAKSNRPRETWSTAAMFLEQFESLPFDNAAALEYGTIRADLERRGKMIGGNDTQIAAIARVNALTLVTHNVAEFSRVPGLEIEDWQVA